MFDWLFEGHLSVYLLLAAAAVLFGVLWVRTRKRRWLGLAAAAAALAGLYCLLDFAVETDREQITRKVRAMAAGFKGAGNLDAVFENVSDQFHNDFAADKKALHDLAARNIQEWAITEVRISDLRWEEISREQGAAVAVFRAKVIGSFGGPDVIPVSCRATFDHDATHGWRMSGLEVRGEPPYQNAPIPQ